jgi:hypothetical protein
MRKISSKHLILVFITSLEYPVQKVSSAALIDALAEYPKSAPAHLTVSPWEPSAISDRADYFWLAGMQWKPSRRGNPVHWAKSSMKRLVVRSATKTVIRLNGIASQSEVAKPNAIVQCLLPVSPRSQDFETRPQTFFAISRARSGGTALPTWWNWAVRGPAKK